MARKIVITSGKGGVGKTTITASLGISLAGLGKKTLIIDGDVGLNNLDVVMGIENRTVYDLSDVLEGKCNISNALVQDEYNALLYILPSAGAFVDNKYSSQVFRQLLARVESEFDFVLVDCPAGLGDGFHRAVSGCDEGIVVTTPHIPSIRDADKTLSVLASYGLSSIGVVVNRVRGDLVLQGNMMDGKEIAKALRYPLLGVVPEDDKLTVYSQLGRLGLSSFPSKIAVDIIANNLVTGERRIYDTTLRFKGVVGKLKMWLEKGL